MYIKTFEKYEYTATKEDYLLLSEILMSNLLDDWEIRARKDEQIGVGEKTSDDPINKFWSFCEYGKNVYALLVYNLGESEIDEFLEEIKELEISKIVRDLTGFELSITSEDTYNDNYDCYFNDVIFKLYKESRIKSFNESRNIKILLIS